MACYLHARDGRPCYYLDDDGDYGYTLDGQSAFYISDGNVYACDGRPLTCLVEIDAIALGDLGDLLIPS